MLLLLHKIHQFCTSSAAFKWADGFGRFVLSISNVQRIKSWLFCNIFRCHAFIMNETSFRTTSTVFMSDMSEQLKYEQCHCLECVSLWSEWVWCVIYIDCVELYCCEYAHAIACYIAEKHLFSRVFFVFWPFQSPQNSNDTNSF